MEAEITNHNAILGLSGAGLHLEASACTPASLSIPCTDALCFRKYLWGWRRLACRQLINNA